MEIMQLLFKLKVKKETQVVSEIQYFIATDVRISSRMFKAFGVMKCS